MSEIGDYAPVIITVTISLAIVFYNWYVVLYYYSTKKYAGSWVPLIGGLILCGAFVFIPNNPYVRWWWLAFVIDWGSLPGITYTLLFHFNRIYIKKENDIIAALKNPDTEVLRALLKKVLDVNAVDSQGIAPLTRAAQSNSNAEILLILMENGANVNITDKDGRTPLMQAAGHNSNPEILRVLLEKGANVNSVDQYGNTPLMRAAGHNSNLEILRLLLDNGANVNTTDKDGRTPLMQAAGHNPNPEILRALLEKGASVNVADVNGWTPLMWAAGRNLIPHISEEFDSINAANPEVLQILLDYGADVTHKNNKGKNALDFAEENQNLKGTDVYKLLQDKMTTT